MKHLIYLALLFHPHLFAAENFIVLNLASSHTVDTSQNEINPGIGLRSYRDKAFYVAGVYKNSRSATSAYVGGGCRMASYKKIDLSLVGGLVSGYRVGAVPFAASEIAVNFNDVKWLINYLPELKINGRTRGGVVGFSVAFKI